MAKKSHGNTPKKRVKLLVEALLDYALNNSDRITNLSVKWDKKTKTLLIVNTTLQALRYLVGDKDGFKPNPKTSETQLKKVIGELLSYYLKDFLGILDDNRATDKGSEDWAFNLKLWSQDKEENLQQLEQLWYEKQSPQSRSSQSESVLPVVETTQDTTPPPPPQSKGIQTVGLETIAEIPVWVGRDALLQELETKLVASETPPKVLTIIGQGGIGKTSLAVKLLETLGVQLQPPTVTETCPYQKALYLKTKQGTSFDEMAAFLLRGLDIETPEPLKTAAEKITKILDGLTTQRSVVVLDNLEDILHPAHHPDCGKALSPEWGQLLHAFAYGNHCSTLILTSREFSVDLTDPRCEGTEPDPDLVFVYSLEGIEIDAGVKLLRQRQLKDKEEDLRWVSERVKGHVFLLTQLAAVARGKPGYLRKHPELVTKKAEPILQVQLERQSEAGLDLLRRMCLLRVAADLRGLTFLRLYEDEWATVNLLTLATSSNQPIQFTDEEISKTELIVKGLVDSSLVQMRYDDQKCELFYDLHQVISDFIGRESEQLPQLFQRVNCFFRSNTSFQTPQSLQELSPLNEFLIFAFHLGDESKADELGMTILNYAIRLGEAKLVENAVLQEANSNQNYDTAEGLIGLAQVHLDLGNWNEAEQYLLESLKIAEGKNKRENIAAARGFLGCIERNRGNWDKAERLYRQSLDLSTELGYRSGIAASSALLGYIEQKRGHWDEAERLYRQSLELMTQLCDSPQERLRQRWGMAAVWGLLGSIDHLRGNLDKAERLYRQSLELSTELGDRWEMAGIWVLLGSIDHLRGNLDEAERLYRQFLEVHTELGDRSGMVAAVWRALGDIQQKRGNLG